MHGHEVMMGQDEHFQDIKRCLISLAGYAKKIVLVMPLLYQSRQDRRNNYESLDCAMALKEIANFGVNEIVTMDVHNNSVSNSILNLPFESFLSADVILKELTSKEKLGDLIVIIPDVGAMKRARVYADMLGINVGLFYKRRDLTKFINGKNPIIEHTYLGDSVKGKTCLVVDDMIASGSSIIEVGEMLKSLGVQKIFFITTFSLFTEDIKCFQKAYQNKWFDKLYTTNLSYIPTSYQDEPWLHVVECFQKIAEIIDEIHQGKSLENFINS